MHDQPVPSVIHFQLTGQSAIGTSLIGRIQHAVFHVIHGRHFVDPGLINVAMAGCTGTGTATFRHYTVDIVVDGTLHHSIAVLDLDLVSFACWRDVSNFGHTLILDSKKRAPLAPAFINCVACLIRCRVLGGVRPAPAVVSVRRPRQGGSVHCAQYHFGLR